MKVEAKKKKSGNKRKRQKLEKFLLSNNSLLGIAVLRNSSVINWRFKLLTNVQLSRNNL